MSFLNEHVRARLGPEELSDCFDRIDWNVQENVQYEGMTDDEVRVYVLHFCLEAQIRLTLVSSEFRKWIESGEEVNDGSARFLACLWVDEMSMKFLTEHDGPPEAFDMHGVLHQYLVSVEEPEGPADGLQAVGLSYLLPRAYLLIEDPGWWIIYKEDGDVSLP